MASFGAVLAAHSSVHARHGRRGDVENQLDAALFEDDDRKSKQSRQRKLTFAIIVSVSITVAWNA
jgi:hypothetical protein